MSVEFVLGSIAGLGLAMIIKSILDLLHLADLEGAEKKR